MHVIYSGFDGLDISLKANISDELNDQLHEVKTYCAEHNTESAVIVEGRFVRLGGHGVRGGYAYMCEIGPCGTKWFIKRPNKNDPWGIRVSASSAALASKGIEGFRAYVDETLKLLGVELPEDGVSITRVDFAVDILAPAFSLDRNNIVTHPRSNISDHGVQSNGRSNRLTSITVGKMPGRQTIIYDKREEVLAKHKYEWFTIWARAAAELGLPDLDFDNAASSRIWRIEARAGKDHLQGKWGIKGWGSLYDKLPALFEESFAQVRYCSPSNDRNRSRWGTHPLWQYAAITVQQRLHEFTPLATIEEIAVIQKEELIAILESQLLGLSTSLAALDGITANTLDQYFYKLARSLGVISRHHKVSPEDRLERAKHRFSRYSTEA